MTTQHTALLREQFTEVLENMAFMFVEEPGAEALPFPGEAVEVSMRFKGHFSGTLRIAVPVAMCADLAINVLGLDADDQLVLDNPYDALQELLNVTCGNVLTAIAGDTPVFDLGIPEVQPMEAAAWEALAASEGIVASVADGYPVLLQLIFPE